MRVYEQQGARYDNTKGQTRFTVWAPHLERVEVLLTERNEALLMRKTATGYHIADANITEGTRYMYRLHTAEGIKDRPDMASCSQPDGVHSPSAVVDLSYDWTDAGWHPPTLRNSVFYQLHVGTFTPEGTFEAIIPQLERLADFGITTLQLLPIAQFPGERNWGYDGVQLYAPHSAYGGVRGLQKLVDAAHHTGIAVYLDLVYNHLGPEGNYLWDYGPYFAHRYVGPWGDSVNYDGPGSDAVRRFFIDNALYWLEHYHIDGFRLDATHALYDFSAYPFLEHLTAEIHDWGERYNKRITVIAENDRSDRKLLLPRAANGTGLDAQWLDDLHHTLHVALTDETGGYYADYADFGLMLKALREGFSYSGQYSPARERRHGTYSGDIPADRFIVCTQNHDQVGNRMLGERLSALTSFEGQKLAAVLLLTSPYVPLIFMGEEYGETAPFLYFIAHGDEGLVEAVREGRKQEFAAFKWQGEPPDPADPQTFERCKLNHELRKQEGSENAQLYDLYAALLRLRRQQDSAISYPQRVGTLVYGDAESRIICVERRRDGFALRIFMNFHRSETQDLTAPDNHNYGWRKLFDAYDPRWYAGDNKPLPEDLPETVTLPPLGWVICGGSLGAFSSMDQG